MFIEAVAVMTLNGLTTIGNKPPFKWASQADQKLLQKKLTEYQDGIAIVGSGTVGPNPEWYVQRALQGGPRRVVMTSRPEEYRKYQHPGRIEFVHLSPEELIAYYEQQGIDKGLLLAGEQVMGSFLEVDRIDRFSLTLEPKIAGYGKGLAVGNFERDFKLVNIKTHVSTPDTIFITYDRKRNE